MERWTRWTLTVAAAVLALTTVSCGNDPALSENPAAAAWIDQASAEAEDTVAEATNDVVAALPDGTRAVAHVTTTRCVEGQHNWKIDDPYDLRCTVTSGTLLAVADDEAFLDDMTAVHDAVDAAGWQPSRSTLPKQLDSYVDSFSKREAPAGNGTTVPYGPQHLPSVSYHRPGEGGGLGFIFTGPDEHNPHVLLFPGDTLVWERTDGHLVEPDEVPDLLTSADYGLLVVSARSRSDP